MAKKLLQILPVEDKDKLKKKDEAKETEKNVTASDVAKKFNVQLTTNDTGSKTTPGVNPVNQIVNATKQKVDALYQNRLTDIYSRAKAYAEQGPEYVLDLANSIVGGNLTSPGSGNAGKLDIDAIYGMTKMNSEISRMLSESGIFNIREIATNPYYAHLSSQDYRKSLLPILQNELTSSQKADEANEAAIAEYEANLRGLRADYAKQAETAAQWKNFFSLLGENPTLDDKLRAAGIATGQTYDMSVFRGMDKYTAYEKKQELDNWFAGLDAAALSATPVVEEPEAPKYTSKTAGIQDEISTLEKYLNAHKTLEELTAYARSNPNFAADSVYTAPDYSNLSAWEQFFAPQMGGAYSGNALATYINTGDVDPYFSQDPGSADYYKRWEELGYNYMLDQDKAIWNVLQKMDPAKASEFLQALSQIYLLPTRAQGYRSWDETVATNPWTAAPAWIGSVGRGIDNILNVPRQLAEAWAGIDNVYSAAFDSLNRQGYTRGAQLDAIQESDMPDWLKTVASYGYQGASSFADNTARLIASGFNPTTSLIMAGMQSASASLHESSSRDDMSGAAKIIKAIGAGVMEVGTEKIGLDALFDKGKKGALQYLKNVVLSEISEETINAASEPMLEAVVAYLFDHEAEIKSGPEFWSDLTDTAITTAISSLLSGGGGVITQRNETAKSGEYTRQNGDPERLLKIATGMAEGTESKRVADEITARINKHPKKGITNYELGKLTQSLGNDLGQERAQVFDRVQDEAIENRLIELGDSPETAKKNAPAIRKLARGEKLTIKERAVDWNENMNQVVRELTRETEDLKPFAPGAVEDVGAQEIDGKWVSGNKYEAENNRTGNKWVTEMGNKQRNETASVRAKMAEYGMAMREPSIGQAATRAEEAAKAKVQKKGGKFTGKPTDTHLTFTRRSDGESSAGELVRFEKAEDGKMTAVVKADGAANGEETKISVEDIDIADGEGIQEIIEYVTDENLPHEVTAEEANALIQSYKTNGGGKATTFIEAFEGSYLRGFSGQQDVGGVIDPAMSKVAYEAGKADAEKYEATRVERAKAAMKVTNPTVGWIGDIEGNTGISGKGDSAALDAEVKNMTDGQRLMVEYGKALAKRAGINVVFYRSKAGADGKITTDNGRYVSATHTIYLDINAGVSDATSLGKANAEGTLGYAMSRTLGHEVTHAIEATSAEFYAKYKQAVKDALGKKGKDWAVLVRNRIDQALSDGKKMTYAEAESEVVADASEYMLQDAKITQELEPGLYNKIKAVVKDFVTKLNDVFRELGLKGSTESRLLREMRDGVYHYMDGLQELWGSAFDEMAGIEGVVSQQRTETSDGKAQSSSRRDAEYMEAVNNSDMTKTQQMVDEAARMAGYEPVKLYHGTRNFGFSKSDTDKSDDKLSIFVTDDRRIAESYSREGADILLENGIKMDRYDFMQQSSAELEPYVQKYVSENFKAPTEKELRAYTDSESAVILSAVDWLDDYLATNEGALDTATRGSITKAMYYAEKLASIPTAKMEDETDGYSLRMKFEDALSDLAWDNRDVYDEIAPAIKQTVYNSSNALISARFSDPFYNTNDGTFVNKWDVMDKLSDKLFAGVYELYGDRKNLLEIDADDSNWNTINGALIGRDGVFVTTREVAEFAKNNGYSGVSIKNVRDGGGMTGYHVASNVLIYFDNTSLKSADPVTYDDNGNVIPLSERFNVNEEDIRHSRRVDRYVRLDGMTEQRYNKYGWAIVNDVLSEQETARFLERIGGIKNGDQYPRSDEGHYIIGVGDGEPEVQNRFIVTDGNYVNPSIERIYSVPFRRESQIEFFRGMFISAEEKSHYLARRNVLEADEEELVAVYGRQDFESLQTLRKEWRSSRSRIFGGQTKQNAGQSGLRGTDESNAGQGELVTSPDGIDIAEDTDSAYFQSSARTWYESDYVTKRDEAAEHLAKTIGVTVSKAQKWIDDVTSIAAYVLDNKARVDYIPTAVKGISAFKSNPEYGGSIDMSTICAKRRLATGTLDAIQRVLGDEVLTKDDFLRIREMMKERGHEVACGLCFVESSRKNLSKYNAQFMEQYNSNHPDGEISMTDLNTVDGLENLRVNNEDAYSEYEKFMNKLAQRKPKLFEKRTEYDHEILKRFKSDTTVGVKNRNGGLRLQSFSDFEIVHLIDMMQVITDMASVGLAGQAYTKVPDFAWALGNTGLKINLSLIAKGVDADGNLIFDDVEGMPYKEAKKLRDYYSENVGTVVVTFTDEQLIAAMKSDFVDYIIPFHRSQWQKSDYKKLGLPEGTKDYTLHQNEKQGRKRVKENFLPNAYWDPDLSGNENAEVYLKMCEADGRTPKFAKFLSKDADGHWVAPDGYWKLLIDFKMCDNNGKGSRQMPVQPNFNMDKAMEMLENYKGTHDSFPVAQDVVDDFVQEYRDSKGGVQKTGGQYTVNPYQSSARTGLPEEMGTREFLSEADDSIAETVDERNALTIYQERLKAHAEASEAVMAAEAALIGKEGQELADARAELAKARKHQKDLYNRLLRVENTEHVQKVIERTQRFINEELHGKTKKQLEKIVADREQKLIDLRAELNGLKAAAKEQRQFDSKEMRESYEKRTLENKARNDSKINDVKAKGLERLENVRADNAGKVANLNAKHEAQLERAVGRANNAATAKFMELNLKNADKVEKLTARIQDTKIRDRVKLEKTIAKYEREIAMLNNKATAKFLENNMKYLDKIADIRERRDLNLEIKKKERRIKRTVKALSDLVIHETDYKNVKEPLKPAVHSLVKTFVDEFGNLVFYNPSDEAVAGGKESALEARQKFERLKAVYDKLADIDGEEAMAYDPEVSAWLAELHTLAESYDTLADITDSKVRLKTKLYIYERLSGIADSIAYMVKTADQIFVNGRRQQIANVAGDVANTLTAKNDRKEFTGKLGEAINALDDVLLKGNMTAVTFFESLENSGLKHLYDDITDAERVSAARVKEARDYIAELMKKHGYLSWGNMRKPVSFVTEQGREVYMTTGNMLWAYATAKRELSNPLTATHHLSEGGFAYDEKTKRTKEVNGSQWKNTHNKLSAKDIVTIEGMLTADQKAFADACVEYLSTECADWGNEASMALFGIKKYNEEHYFPYQVDKDQLHKNSAAGSASTTDDARLKHISFSHSVTANANKPLVMGDFLDIVDNHINQMAIYSAFVLPIENLNRVLNSKVEYQDEMVTIRSLIASKHGKAAQKYLTDFLKDMNGVPQTDKRGELNSFIRLFKKSAVMGKLQVALQQYSSIARAFVYINPKYFLNIPKELPYTTWERMMQYSGTTVYKDMGGFNIGLGQQAADWIGKGALEEYGYWKRGKFLLDQKGVAAMKDNYVDFLTALPGVVDKMTWAAIWTATENEQADLHPGMDRNSVEFLEMVGERFDDVVRHSQVYDSVLAKSQNMRSKSGLARMATAFMAEPTLTMNMLYSAFKNGDKKLIARTAVSLVLNAVLGALGYAAIAAWDKDDDERTATEKFVTKFAGKLADSINPLTMIPFVSDFWSIINGYDVERTDMAVFADLYKYGKQFFEKLDEGKEITFRDYENFLGTVATVTTGVPAKNLMGDFRRLVLNLPETDFSAPEASRVKYGVLDEIMPFRDTSNTAYYERYLGAMKDGDKQEMYDLKDYLMATKGVKETNITQKVREAYGKEYKRGGIEKQDAINFLLANGLVTGETEAKRKQSAFDCVDGWDEGTDGHSVYNTLRQAFSGGNSTEIQKAWKELEQNGWETDTIGNYVRGTIIKDMVTNGQITPSKATEMIRKYYPYKKDSDNVSKPQEWLKDK